MVASSETARKVAEELRIKGNALFAKEKFSAAIDCFTEAITSCPDMPALYVNRGLCYKRKADAVSTLENAEFALHLDKEYMKAHYLAGWAARELGQWQKAVTHLLKALDAARKLNDGIKDDLWHELAKAKFSQWQADSSLRRSQRRKLQAQLASWMSEPTHAQQQPLQGAAHEQESSHASSNGNGVPPGRDEQQAAWDTLFQEAAQKDEAVEVPGAFTCPLTMEVFRDPVITPAGNSYERSSILEHLRKVGQWDPINRDCRVTADQLIPNVQLRTAVQHYLDEHPWAWGECR